MIKEHDWLCPQHPDWGYVSTECHCVWIRVGRADERSQWIEWAGRHKCCEAGLVASPDPCPWHDLTSEPDMV